MAWLLAPLAAVAVTLIVSSLLVLWAGAPLAQTYGLLFKGAFGSVFALTETLTRAVPLMLTGLACAVAFRARLFNIGAEGQLYAGALAAVMVGGMHGGEGWALPPALLFILMIAASALAGGLLLLGPALLKSRLGVDEVTRRPWAGRKAWRCKASSNWASSSSKRACTPACSARWRWHWGCGCCSSTV